MFCMPTWCPNYQFLLCQLLIWIVLRPCFRSCQVESTTCINGCALLNSHLHASCQCLRCWIPRQPQFLSAYPPDEFSCLAWKVYRLAHIHQQSSLLIFLWLIFNCTNLQCRFIPSLAWLPTPLDTVLDSLPKYATHAHLTLLHIHQHSTSPIHPEDTSIPPCSHVYLAFLV